MSLSAEKLWGLQRIADAGGRFKVTAVDQRPPIRSPIRERRGLNELADHEALPWTEHRRLAAHGPRVDLADASFRHVYRGFGGNG